MRPGGVLAYVVTDRISRLHSAHPRYLNSLLPECPCCPDLSDADCPLLEHRLSSLRVVPAVPPERIELEIRWYIPYDQFHALQVEQSWLRVDPNPELGRIRATLHCQVVVALVESDHHWVAAFVEDVMLAISCCRSEPQSLHVLLVVSIFALLN